METGLEVLNSSLLPSHAGLSVPRKATLPSTSTECKSKEQVYFNSWGAQSLNYIFHLPPMMTMTCLSFP